MVGGGPAGLLAACKLSEAGFNVILYEEHKKIGYPEHCTGIVRSDFLSMSGYSDLGSLEISRYTGGEVVMEGREFSVDTGAVKALMIDRPGYEAKLAEIAESTGVRIRLGCKADILLRGKKPTIRTREGLETPDLVIGARGPSYNPALRVLPGLQARVRLQERVDPSRVRVFFSRRLPGFFGWLAPYSEGRYAKLGLAAATKNVRALLPEIAKMSGVRHELLGYFGGKVVVGGAYTIGSMSDYVPVGDEAGLAKPLTGGGLGLGAKGVLELSSSLYRGDLSLRQYRLWLAKTKRSLFFSEIIGRLVFNLPPAVKTRAFERVFNFPGLGSALRVSDFDDHLSAILYLTKSFLANLF